MARLVQIIVKRWGFELFKSYESKKYNESEKDKDPGTSNKHMPGKISITEGNNLLPPA